jgi:predicted glutamine amidotransferase
MCIAILNIGNKLTDKQLHNSWATNPHGAGLLFTDNKGIQIHKEMNNVKSFIKEYNKVYDTYDSPIVLHFRIKTHGLTNIDNCHPFQVNNKLAFVHNGMMDNVPYHKEKSETRIFNETILQHLPDNFLNNPAIVDMIENYIGYSKLVFLNASKEYQIINENLGNWETCGNWYSNDSHKCKVSYTKHNKPYQLGNFKQTSKYDECDSCKVVSHKLKYNEDYAMHLCDMCEEWYESTLKF